MNGPDFNTEVNRHADKVAERWDFTQEDRIYTAAKKMFARTEVIPWSGCWIYMGGVTKLGYGQVYDGGCRVYAHRLSYRLANGEIPHGLNVLHSCDVPCCVNPLHLRLGTQSDNVRDAYNRNRRQPTKGPSAKTHCPAGHPYDEANTSFRPNGHRRCRTCHREQERSRVCAS